MAALEKESGRALQTRRPGRILINCNYDHTDRTAIAEPRTAQGTIASEEEDLPVAVEETYSGNYVVVFDPLDGSSNIDAGISTGSIFGIYDPNDECSLEVGGTLHSASLSPTAEPSGAARGRPCA